ncbi:hypothetical protein D9619_013691 [Psilocybe cf. subviscida]|uniref:Aminoglycoside phosphotransferase domain-containing protein n=1 Tax=Psilocybe cf. subviscida TaxID=2480587 RepID=A0A8H5EVF5_9AGAR|nr:hypothetical protein D9619_013691 [Psilocybe cf. subviscida]
MPNIEVFIDATNKPQNLLDDPRVIVELCRRAQAAPLPNLNQPHGVPLIDTPHTTIPYAWVKYGSSIQCGEAWTQHFLASTVNPRPMCTVRVPHVYLAFQWDDCVFIVMEYIHGSPCAVDDIPLVAAAVRTLIQIQPPLTAVATPWSSARRLYRAPLFVYNIASVVYSSVAQPESHVNRASSSSFRTPHPQAYISDDNDDISDRSSRSGASARPWTSRQRSESRARVSARATWTAPTSSSIQTGPSWLSILARPCFLPPSFFSYAIYVSTRSSFHQLLAREIETAYPRSTQLSNMLDAAYTLVPYGKNSIALLDELRVPPRRRNRNTAAS